MDIDLLLNALLIGLAALLVIDLIRTRRSGPVVRSREAGTIVAVVGFVASVVGLTQLSLALVLLGVAIWGVTPWLQRAWRRRRLSLWDAYEPLLRDDLASLTHERAADTVRVLEGRRWREDEAELAALLLAGYQDWVTGAANPMTAVSVWRVVRAHEIAVARWPERVPADPVKAERRWRMWRAYERLHAAEGDPSVLDELMRSIADLPDPVDPEEAEMVDFIRSAAQGLASGTYDLSLEDGEQVLDLYHRVWPSDAVFAGAPAGPRPPDYVSGPMTATGT